MNPVMLMEIEGIGKVAVERSIRARRMRITVKPGLIRVSVPRGIPLETGRAFAMTHVPWICRQTSRIESRTQVHKELLADLPPITDREKASQMIISRCRELACETGLGFSRITIRDQKTIWGSCSSRNSISLNINLARLPERLMDYVIMHELVHTKIRGHGHDFWDELERYLPDSKSLRRELKKYLLRLL
ncbi:MAG: M48 family metallopeptidase [Deltaproteobacteria bacterium]|nr:M48 family metallopeptidase [Deltaproteobacteria bacterium]